MSGSGDVVAIDKPDGLDLCFLPVNGPHALASGIVHDHTGRKEGNPRCAPVKAKE